MNIDYNQANIIRVRLNSASLVKFLPPEIGNNSKFCVAAGNEDNVFSHVNGVFKITFKTYFHGFCSRLSGSFTL